MSKLHAVLEALTLCLSCLIVSIFLSAWFDKPQSVGVALPQGSAVFETSLQSRISSTDTSMTLVSNSVRGGESLSGYNCFTIDEGRSDAEFVCGTVSGTSVTSLERGLSFSTGTTTVTVLKFAHRVGANVKITDFPLIQRIRHQLSGTDTIESILKYTSHPTFTATTDIVDKKYVDDTAFSGAGVIDATTVARGVSELATTLETASSTPTGSSGVLVIPASNATSTFNSATAALRVVVTQNNGKIDNYFIATSTLFTNQAFSVGTTTISGNLTITGTSTVASTTIRAFTASTTPTTTWTKPSNIKFVIVEVQAAGGNGAAAGAISGGGGGGGYCKEVIPAAALGSTETVTVGGVSGAGTGTGGPSSFGSHCTTTGGATGSGGDGGAGGTASSGNININGGDADDGTGMEIPNSGATDLCIGGRGGDSILGNSGSGSAEVATTCTASGTAGDGYGAGGGNGASGAGGAIFVTEVYF